MKPNELTALEALNEIAAGRLNSQSLVEACLGRIAERESSIGAWQFISPDAARTAAREVDNSPTSGALKGIPVAVKDIFDTADMPTTYGSPIYAEHQPAADASTVAMTRASGGIILGKTVTTEFAYFHPGKTANPHNLKHTPGGSSSGSAAAVADFMVPLALGSQTVGSTIRPASFCGIVGFKPSFGFIDRTGIRPLADAFDTIGLFARDVADIAYFFSILSQRPYLSLDKRADEAPTIGLCHTPEWPAAEPDTCAALEKAATLAADNGAKVREITLPQQFAELGEAQGLIVDYQAAITATFELTFRREQLSEAFLERAEVGQSFSTMQYDAALEIVNSAKMAFDSLMERFDVLLIPSAPGEAPLGLHQTGNPIFNRLGTAIRGPCLNVPGLKGDRNMPIGVQLIGRMGEDQILLRTGHWLFNLLNKKTKISTEPI